MTTITIVIKEEGGQFTIDCKKVDQNATRVEFGAGMMVEREVKNYVKKLTRRAGGKWVS